MVLAMNPDEETFYCISRFLTRVKVESLEVEMQENKCIIIIIIVDITLVGCKS